jgi:hypothetical protein
MDKLVIKTRRGPLTITGLDEIMYNGSCYQLTTQSYYQNRGYYSYELSKNTCKRLIKKNILIPKRKAKRNGIDLVYYALNPDKID